MLTCLLSPHVARRYGGTNVAPSFRVIHPSDELTDHIKRIGLPGEGALSDACFQMKKGGSGQGARGTLMKRTAAMLTIGSPVFFLRVWLPRARIRLSTH